MPKPFQLIDLSHRLSSSIPTWEGECGFHHCREKDYRLNFCRTHKIEMNEGIGTHMDAPAHFFEGGKTIDDLDINELFAPCVVIDISHKAHESYSLSLEDFHAFEEKYGKIQEGSFVLVYTGWDQFWEDPEKYRNDLKFPSVSDDVAERLLERNISGLGIDTLSPDRPEDGYPVHQLILGAGKVLIENIAQASLLPVKGAYLLALPLRIQGGTESPLRLVGMVGNCS